MCYLILGCLALGPRPRDYTLHAPLPALPALCAPFRFPPTPVGRPINKRLSISRFVFTMCGNKNSRKAKAESSWCKLLASRLRRMGGGRLGGVTSEAFAVLRTELAWL